MSTKLLVCTKGKTCCKLGGKDVYRALKNEIENLGLESTIKIKKTDCLGYCGRGPAVKVKHGKLTYGRVSPKDCRDIVRSLIECKSIERLKIKK